MHAAWSPPIPIVRRRARRRARAFSLLEALVASVALAVIVLAVGSAVSAGRQQSREAEVTILATIAADDLMSELSTVAYADLPKHNGLAQAPGAMKTLTGIDYPTTYAEIGRSVLVENATVAEQSLGIIIVGKRVVVTAHDENRVLASLETFIPEPAP
jgi:Tfp pilus assembly protein PilV